MPSIDKLLTPKEMSEKVKGAVGPKRLEELARSQFIPHYVVDGNVMFGAEEAKEWLNHNFVTRVPGVNTDGGVARIINVVGPSLAAMDIPMELRAVAGFLVPMALESIETCPFSGVYFLCSKGEVVYVGQSVNVPNRIGQHFGNKTFDMAFFMRLPESDLDFVEGAFIRALEPRYNFGKQHGNLVAPSGIVWDERRAKPQDPASIAAVEAINAAVA